MLSVIYVTAQNGRIDLRSETRAEITKNDFTSLEASFSFSSIESQTINTERGLFSELIIPGTYPSGNLGQPSLPAVNQLIAIPFGATPRVVVKNYTVEEYSLSDYGIQTIMPLQPSLRKDQDHREQPFMFDQQAYQTRGFNDNALTSIEMRGTMRGINVGALTLNPVQYNPVDNIIRVYNNIDVEIIFDNADLRNTEEMLLATYSPYFDIVYRQMFNYRAIQSVYDDHPDLWAAPVRMIVVAPSSYVTTLEPWLNWKKQKGFYVNLFTLEQTGTTYSAIKTFIQNQYNTGVAAGQTPTFVVIVGDTGQVPASAPSASATQKASDLYYGSVDNDHFPDMFYSRMSASSTSELTAIINKVLTYEKYTMSDPSYLGNALLIAGADSFWNPIIGKPTINYAEQYYFNSSYGYNNVYKYINSYTGCYNNLNTGVGFANYTAHGTETAWHDPYFSNSNVNSLTNTDKYFVAMGNCCLTSDFGYGTCFGEAMIRANNKGAVGYIGSSPYSYWYEDFYFGVGAATIYNNGQTPSQTQSSIGVYDGLFMEDTYNTLSSMVFVGNLAVCYAHANNYQGAVSDTYYWQAYNVLGDASLMPYTAIPSALSVSHAATIPSGATSFTVGAEQGSYVAISKDNELLGTALIGTSGTANVTISSPVSSGSVMLVVTRPKRQPYITTIPVGGGNSTPNVVFASCTPDEIVNGENTSLTVTMRNSGNAATTTPTAVTISSSDSYLTIVNGQASFGAMTANGGTATVQNAFTVRAADNTPANHTFTVNVAATNGNNTWNSQFTLANIVPCNAPTNLTATANGLTINLSWTASNSAVSYRVFRNNTMIANNVTATSYTDTNLNPGTQYSYTVKSNCAGGDISEPSNTATATTDDPCNPPTNLTTIVKDYTNIELSWTASSYAESYKIFRNNTMIADGITASTYTDEDLQEGSYCYTVKSVCSNGESSHSNNSCQTIALPCTPPQNLEGAYVFNGNTDYGVLVEWDAPSLDATRDIVKYNLYYSDNGNSYELLGEIDHVAGQSHYEYFDQRNSGLAFYQVKASYQWGGQSCESTPAMSLENPNNNHIMVMVTDINETTVTNKIYPNPANDKLFVSSTAHISILRVYDIMGNEVLASRDCGSDAELNLSSLPSGVYFIQLTTNSTMETLRFIKE